MTKMSNEGQFAKARKAYGKDFYAKSGSNSDQALKKGAETMERGSVKMGRFATGGAARQPRDANMRFATGGTIRRASGGKADKDTIEFSGEELDRVMSGNSEPEKMPKGLNRLEAGRAANDIQRRKGKSSEAAMDAQSVIWLGQSGKKDRPTKDEYRDRAKELSESKLARGGSPRHSLTEDRRDQMADRISGKKRGMSAKAFEGTPADERMDKMKSPPMNKGGAPRSKAGRYQTGGTVKPVKRNMGGMMGDPALMDQMQRGAAGRLPPAPPPVGGQGIGNMIGTNPNPMQRGLPGGRGMMATPTPMERPMQQQDFGGDQGAGGFKRGGHPAPIKRAMGGVGKIRHNQASPQGKPKAPASRASYGKTVI